MSMAKNRPGQTGVVLIVALVVMGVMAVTSALAIRSVTTGDKVGSNIRAQAMAMHAAEVALRWCEADVLGGGTGQRLVPVDRTNSVSPGAASGGNERWRALNNWQNRQIAIQVPADLLRTTVGSLTIQPYQNLPLCMAQLVNRYNAGAAADSAYEVLLITARGFAPDYAPANGGVPSSGGEVWLQSQIRNSAFRAVR